MTHTTPPTGPAAGGQTLTLHAEAGVTLDHLCRYLRQQAGAAGQHLDAARLNALMIEADREMLCHWGSTLLGRGLRWSGGQACGSTDPWLRSGAAPGPAHVHLPLELWLETPQAAWVGTTATPEPDLDELSAAQRWSMNQALLRCVPGAHPRSAALSGPTPEGPIPGPWAPAEGRVWYSPEDLCSGLPGEEVLRDHLKEHHW